MLESAESLRFEGTCITLWTNAMRVLEVLGLADKFRTMYHNIPEYVLLPRTINTCLFMSQDYIQLPISYLKVKIKYAHELTFVQL